MRTTQLLFLSTSGVNSSNRLRVNPRVLLGELGSERSLRWGFETLKQKSFESN